MSNPSKEKGTRAETLVKDALKAATGLKWERTPLSGALNAKHGLKSDLYIPNEKNLYAVEVKHYADSAISHLILTSKSSTLIDWWKQSIRQAEETNKEPLLIFKHDRSKLFVAFKDIPSCTYSHIFISVREYEFYVALLDDWLINEAPKFIA